MTPDDARTGVSAIMRKQGLKLRPIGALAVALSGLILVCGRAAPAGNPEIVLEKPTLDIGEILAGGIKELSFPVRNRGAAPLRITAVDAGCGCLTPSYPQALAPGAAGEIRFKFEPAATWYGPMEKHIQVSSSDPNHPTSELLLTCKVIPFVQVEPSLLVQVPYRAGETYQKEVTLIPRQGSGLKITGVSSSTRLIRTTLEQPAPDDPRRAYRLKMTIGPWEGPGDWDARVRFKTSEPKLPQWFIAVSGQALEGPVVAPREIYLPTVPRRNLEGKQLARIQVLTREPKLRVLKVETGTPLLTASVVAKIPDRVYEITLQGAGEWKSGEMEATIRLTTDHKTYPTITVPFHATVQ